jgi:16S rRNA (cytidine1402-2'-O)-methyltransferase
MPTLYIVPTPIGNLEDITLRALRILKEVSLIAAEDTRTSRVLLRHYDITTPLTSYHEHNKLAKLDTIFDALETNDVALISDAGTPGISDPGYELINEAIKRDIRIEPLPGPTAIIPALVASGLPTDSFVYLGFLPKKQKAKEEFLYSVEDEKRTLVFYESPKRLTKTLQTILETLGNRPACVARELTKIYEEFQRGNIEDILAHYTENPPRGEIVLIIGNETIEDDKPWSEERVFEELNERLVHGESLSGAAKDIATISGWRKRDVYAMGKEIP